MADTPPVDPAGDSPLPMESGIASTHVYLLLGLFLAGFLALVVLHQFTAYLVGELNRKTANEHARLSLGEIVINDLVRIEASVYRMATIRGDRGQRWARRDAERQIDELREALRVLDHGGTLKRATRLNIESQEWMTRTIEYRPEERESRYVLEVIDVWPKLQQIERKIDRLAELLSRRESTGERGDGDTRLAAEREIKGFLRSLPPLFTRLNENANRLFFESRRRLDALENDLQRRRELYGLAERWLTIAIVLVVLALGFVILRQLADSNRRLREAGAEMATARRAAEAANRAKSNFLANMSHELRTPMNAVLGYAQLLRGDPALGDSHREDVEQILTSGNHLLDLINDVLDLSKVESGRLELESITFPLPELVEEVARSYALQAHAKGLELIVAPSPGLPREVAGDPTRLRQVLINLLGNAIKFTENGEVELSARPVDDGEIRFDVRDTGIGIAEESRDRLFQPFTQGDDSMTRRFGGTGLGLVLTKQLVEAMGGRIEWWSRAGEGSRFTIHLPLTVELDAPPPQAALAGQRVLLVDGNAAARAALAEPLRVWGAELTEAADGATAVTCLHEAPVHWLITEQRLADMEGIELARRVTGMAGPPPRMVLVTAAHLPDEETLHAAGIEAQLTKPLATHPLREALLNPSAPPPPRPATIDRDDVSPPLHGRILLVEDNFINRQVATGMLLQFGLEVESAEDGEEALERLAERRYDLVLMDVQMPRMDGYEATRRLRQREIDNDAPRTLVIAMTANTMIGDREKCLEAGMDDHLPKPVDMKGLRERLALWMNRA